MYDYIISGAGAAGLSLAYRFCSQDFFKNKKILIADKSLKNENDRTWCFWTKNPTLFDGIITNKWENIWFYSETFSKNIALEPYSYQMLKGIDFYRFVFEKIEKNPNVDIVYGDISNVQSNEEGASLDVDGKTYHSKWIFNSIYHPEPENKLKYQYFKQHFKGWFIETAKPFFKPEDATMMDFRIPQIAGEARFMYVLPFSPTKALVEFTVFSEELLKKEEYDGFVEYYLNEYLKITEYRIIEKEFGIIPMFDAPFTLQPSKHVLNIGIAGGQAKVSTGYVFMNIQKQCDLITNSLIKRDSPMYKIPNHLRFHIYDTMLLNVIAQERYDIAKIFSVLFEKNSISSVFRFLDEESSFLEELKIMSQMPYMPFLKSLPKGMVHL